MISRLSTRVSILAFILATPLTQLFAQTPGPITTPLIEITDFASDTAVQPLAEVTGGQTSSTLGIEVTSQAVASSDANPLTLLGMISGTGYGGLSLVQLGTANTGGLVGINSPFFSLCSKQYIGSPSSVSTPECWSLQAIGGTIANPPDVLNLTHTNPTGNFTLQVPTGLNFAAGNATSGGQLTIGSVPSSAVSLALRPVTVVGGFTSNITSGQYPVAGNLQLFPGFLNPAPPNVPNPDARSLEGSLQIGMAVKGNPSQQGLLACYSAAQTAQACPNVSAPLLGVYFQVGAGSTQGSNGVITPPGRAPVLSNSSATWAAGTQVCRDPNNPNFAIAALTSAPVSVNACPIGQAVGVAVGDSTVLCPCVSHLVDLDFSDQGVGSTGYWSAGPLNTANTAAVTVPSNQSEVAYGFYLASEVVSSTLVLDVKTGDTTSDTYSFGIFSNTGAVVAHISPQSFGSSAVVTSLFAEGTVTFTPGEYYFGYTGTGGLGSLVLVPFQAILIPFAQTTVLAAGSTSGTVINFSPTPDSWVASGTSAAAFALAK